MSSDPNQNSADLMPKPMKGKYDGRRNNGRYKSKAKRGPKPFYLKALSRNGAAKILEKLNAIATPEEIYRQAFERKLFALCWQIREDLSNRVWGKPYTAENPQKADPASSLREDQRLQDAITHLVPAKPSKPTVM